jgi:hypothetical protein
MSLSRLAAPTAPFVPVAPGRAKLALIFDDGYQNNVTIALPILQKYGFAATMALEIERVNLNYDSNPNLPVVTADDLRSWIRGGGEICNHTALTLADSESVMASKAVAENQRLRDILTGALVWNGSAFVSGTPMYPEYATYGVDSAVYRGGARNANSDAAYATIFDKIRGINGDIATRGDGIYLTDAQGEMPCLWSAFSIDNSGSAATLANMLSFVRSLAGTESTGVIYGHFTPPSVPGFAAPPYITAADLEALCRACVEDGVEIVPFNRLGACNLVGPQSFADVNSMTFGAPSVGDTAAWDTGVVLNSLPRSIRLTAAAQRAGGARPSATTNAFVVAPFSRYRVRLRYKIDTALNRGGANPNHGIEVRLVTVSQDSGGSSDLDISGYQLNPAVAIPFDVTSGWATYDTILFTGLGMRGSVSASLFNASGTAWIGHISVEKLDSFSRRPYAITANFNTVIATRITLPVPTNAGSRRWRWMATVDGTNVTSTTTTVSYAAEASADVATPTTGQTVYVLGRGSGDFATRGGQIGTWSGSAWGSWTTPSDNTVINATVNGEGFAAAHYFHHRRSSIGGQFTRLYARAYGDLPFVQRINAGVFDVWHSSGSRSDAFRLLCTPIVEA